MMEAQILLSTMLQKLDFELASADAPDAEIMVTLRPRSDFEVIIRARKAKEASV